MNILQQVKEKGYTTVYNKHIVELINNFTIDVEQLSLFSKDKDIFKCEHGIKQIQNLHFNPRFMGLSSSLKELIQSPKAEVLNMQYFIKYPNYKITSPHQDGQYFNNSDKTIITFWIPLQDVSEINSCMFYVPKSHENGLLKHENVGTKVRTRTGKTGYSQYCNQYELKDFIPIKLKKGEMVIHDQFTVHYSNENKTNQRRIAVTCIMEIE